MSVSGNGFSPGAKVGIYFDRTYEGSTAAGSSGSFSNKGIKIPASATPGEHRVSAKDSTGIGAHVLFGVNTNWATFGFQPAGGRWNPYENQLNRSTVGDLGLSWSYTTGLLVSSPPVAVDGVIYVGSLDNNLYALDAASGSELWRFTTKGQVADSPAVVAGMVYFGSDDGNVYALNASSGTKLWSFNTGTPVFSSPAVANGVVYIGSDNGYLYALDAATGAQFWIFNAGAAVTSSPAVADGVVCVGSQDYSFYAVDAVTVVPNCGASTLEAKWTPRLPSLMERSTSAHSITIFTLWTFRPESCFGTSRPTSKWPLHPPWSTELSTSVLSITTSTR